MSDRYPDRYPERSPERSPERQRPPSRGRPPSHANASWERSASPSRSRDSHPAPAPTRPAAHASGRSPAKIIVAVVALLALGVTLAYGVWVFHASQEAARPLAAAAAYCAALQHKDYTRAYALLTPSAQQQTPSQTFALAAQDSDTLDGAIRGCSVPSATFTDGFTFNPGSASDTVRMTITRDKTLAGAISLAQVHGAWLVNMLDPALSGTDVSALVTAQQFCASLVAKDYPTAYQDLSATLRGRVTQAALAPMFGATSVTALSGCQPTVNSYTLATAVATNAATNAATASVRATLTVKITSAASPRSVTLPITLTLARATAWQIASITLTPAGMTAAQTTASLGAPKLPSGAPSAPALTADEAILVNPATNQVYYALNADHPHAMASTTKIMTAVVALTVGNLDQKIPIGSDVITELQGTGASVAYLVPGDALTLRDLLYALLLPSGDDAAIAIADGITGSQPAYVALMNMEAALLGLTNTHYANAHGLDAPGHHSTARDLATLTEFAMRFPAFAKTVATPLWNEAAASGHHAYTWTSTNDLLPTMPTPFPGVTGIKTGYTGNAGGCLVFSATRNGHQLIGVVLGEPAGTTADHPARFIDAAALLTWGFHLEGQS